MRFKISKVKDGLGMKLRNVAIAALSVLTLFGGGAAVYGTSQVRAAQQQFVYSGYLLDGSENQ